MTIKSFERAQEIKQQIESINQLIDNLSGCYKCEPPTRMTSFDICSNLGSSNWSKTLNEGEITHIIAALECLRSNLEREFGIL